MNNEKEYTEGIRLQKRREGGRAENFWYHYKWPVIGVLVFALIFGICIAQSCSKENDDILLLYAGPHLLTANELASVKEVMTGVMPYDFDGNGEKRVGISTYNIYSREQIEQIAAEDASVRFDTARNSSELKVYQEYIKKGESAVYLLDPWLYESLRDDPACPLQLLSDVLAEMPQGALADGYGVRLGDTELYKSYAVLQALPEDTVVCLSRPYVLGKTSKEEFYLLEKKMFAALVDGSLKES